MADNLPVGRRVPSSLLPAPLPSLLPAPQPSLLPCACLQLEDWLADNLPEGGRVGIDPFLHTVDSVRRLKAKLEVRTCWSHTPHTFILHTNGSPARWKAPSSVNPPHHPVSVHTAHFHVYDHPPARSPVYSLLGRFSSRCCTMPTLWTPPGAPTAPPRPRTRSASIPCSGRGRPSRRSWSG